MMNNTPDAALRRKGIFLLIMPLILLPILFLLSFNSEPVLAQTQESTNGMNLEIPSPILANKQESKSEAYVKEKETLDEKTPWGLPDFLLNQPGSEGLSEVDQSSEKEQFRFSSVSNLSSSRSPRNVDRVNSDPEEEGFEPTP